MKLTTDINHAARLLDVDEYHIEGADMLYGFVAGVLAGNYDITELFIDGPAQDRRSQHWIAAAALLAKIRCHHQQCGGHCDRLLRGGCPAGEHQEVSPRLISRQLCGTLRMPCTADRNITQNHS